MVSTRLFLGVVLSGLLLVGGRALADDEQPQSDEPDTQAPGKDRPSPNKKTKPNASKDQPGKKANIQDQQPPKKNSRPAGYGRRVASAPVRMVTPPTTLYGRRTTSTPVRLFGPPATPGRVYRPVVRRLAPPDVTVDAGRASGASYFVPASRRLAPPDGAVAYETMAKPMKHKKKRTPRRVVR
jgi:hypothetical protein